LRETAHSLNSSTTLFSNRSPHLICRMIKNKAYKAYFSDRLQMGSKVSSNNLAFSFVRSIIACVQACDIRCTRRVGNAFGQLYSEKRLLIG
jgi:hypothetical protein